MTGQFYVPWMGANFSSTRTLLLSESAYDWEGEDGEVCSPSANHPTESVTWAIDVFPAQEARYFNAVTRAICRKQDPTVQERRAAWDDYAYTIYIPGSVGFGPGARSTAETWDRARSQFRGLISDLQPRRIIITGREAWREMPECDVELVRDLQAYRLSDRQLVWCQALPHPRNQIEGFAWQRFAECIALFLISFSSPNLGVTTRDPGGEWPDRWFRSKHTLPTDYADSKSSPLSGKSLTPTTDCVCWPASHARSTPHQPTRGCGGDVRWAYPRPGKRKNGSQSHTALLSRS